MRRVDHPVGRMAAIPALLGLSLAWLLAFALPASAHAYPINSEDIPGDGLTVKTLPSAIQMTTGEGITQATVTVQSTAGVNIATGKAQFTPGQTHVSVPISPTAAPGDYVVQWQFTSLDTHVTTGIWGFEYQPHAQGTKAQCAANETLCDHVNPHAPGSGSQGDSTPAGLVIGVVLAGIAVGGGIAFASTRRAASSADR